MTLFQPLTTQIDREVEAAFRDSGLQVRKLHDTLYDFDGTWCPVILTRDQQGGRDIWRVSRRMRANKIKRWRTVYAGLSLPTALRHALRYKETMP